MLLFISTNKFFHAVLKNKKKKNNLIDFSLKNICNFFFLTCKLEFRTVKKKLCNTKIYIFKYSD